jgi:WD40 repeat protein
MNSDPNQFICGFNDGSISLFDIVKLQFTSNLNTIKIDKNDKHFHDKSFYQPNCLISNNLSTIYGGFEDYSIKSFDLRTGKLIK